MRFQDRYECFEIKDSQNHRII